MLGICQQTENFRASAELRSVSRCSFTSSVVVLDCAAARGGGIVEDVLEVGPAGMSTCNWHFSANWESEETRRGAQLGMVGMAALEHSSPHSAI